MYKRNDREVTHVGRRGLLVAPAAQAARCAGRGLTLVEAVISIMVVSTMLVAALNTLGAAKVSEKKASEFGRGMLLAQDLMAEIVQQAYEDPDLAPGSFGLGADEVGDGSRALWEDVDDYDGWSASPPQTKDGSEIAGFDGWERRVTVEWVSPDNLSQAVMSDQRAKYIVVTVLYNDVEVAVLTAVRTAAMPSGVGLWRSRGSGG